MHLGRQREDSRRLAGFICRNKFNPNGHPPQIRGHIYNQEGFACMPYFFAIFGNRVKLGLVEGDMEERSSDFPSTGIVRSSVSVRPDCRGAQASNHCQRHEGKEDPVNTTHLFTFLRLFCNSSENSSIYQ